MINADWVARGKEVLDIEIEGLGFVRDRLGESFHNAVTMLGACKGRVVVTGIGKSGLVGKKIAATFSSTGTPSFFMHPVEGAHGDLGSVRAEDIVIAISYSGKNVELNALLPTLSSMGLKIIALTGGVEAQLGKLADIVIDCSIPREACPMNLAPTTSTTATLAIGDALAACLVDLKSFTASDFKKFHPGGALGQRLRLAVSDIMHTDNIPFASSSLSLDKALAIMDKSGFGAVLLVDKHNVLTGILTDGDIRRAVCRGGFDASKPVASIMTKNPMHAFSTQSAAELMDIMERTAITVLPIIDSGKKVVGIVHMHDLLGKGQVSFAG